jgi:hypothetical protein
MLKTQNTNDFGILVDNNGTCMISDIARNNLQEQAMTEAKINSMVYANNRFVAVGQAGTIVTLEKE